MKIKIEPTRLKRCVDNAMISKSKPTINPAVFIFEPEKVTNWGIVGGQIGTYQELKKNYFLEYECKEKEIVPISDAVNEKLKWGFDSAEMNVETKKDQITFKGTKDTYETTLENYEPIKMPWKFEYNKEIGGFVPIFNFSHNPEWDKKTVELNSLLEVEKEELKLPQTAEYELIFDKSGLTVRIPEAGSFSRKISCNVLRDTPITVKVDTLNFTTITENLNDKVRIALTEDMIIFFEEKKDHNTTYFLATQVA